MLEITYCTTNYFFKINFVRINFFLFPLFFSNRKQIALVSIYNISCIYIQRYSVCLIVLLLIKTHFIVTLSYFVDTIQVFISVRYLEVCGAIATKCTRHFLMRMSTL